MVRFNQCLGLAAVAMAALTSAPAQAEYFIRPYIQLGGGGIIDGYEADGATSGTQFFGTDYVSTVDLAEGKIHEYLRMDGSEGAGTVAGIFGDRVRFTGDVGSTITLNFDVSGTLFADAPVNESLFLVVNTNFYVFEAGSGANYTNFNSLPGAVLSKPSFDVFNPQDVFTLDYAKTLSGSFALSGSGNYDIFASIAISIAKNGNPGLAEMDFSHTAALSIDAAPGVSYVSDSGAFVGSTPAVPEPASWAMMIGGFALVGGQLRQRGIRGLRIATA